MSAATDVKIAITWTGERALRIDSPFFRADRHICNMGTNNAAVLVFDRPDELAEYNLMLRFWAGGVPYIEDISLGSANTYKLHNAFTQAEDLTLVILLYDGDRQLAASNAGVMRLRPDGHVRGLPVDGYEIVPFLIPGEKGEDGVSPTATVTQTATGAIISVTDASGTTTAELLNNISGGDGTGDHSRLTKLDYVDSGHTGFAPAGNYATIVYNDNHLEFPNQGNTKNIYIDMSSDKIYRWDSSNLKYYELGASFDDIKIISGGGAGG